MAIQTIRTMVVRHLPAFTLLLGLGALSCKSDKLHQAEPLIHKEKPLIHKEEIAMKTNPWGMTDNDFWDPESEKAEKARDDNAQPRYHPDSPMPRHYLEIGVPSEVRIGEHDTLPLVLVMRQSNYDSWVYNRHLNASVWAINLETNEYRVSNLENIDYLIRDFDWDYEPGVSASMTTMFIDLFAVTQIPKEEGTWIVRVINHHIVSNAVVVRIKGGSKPSSPGRPTLAPLASSFSYPQCPEPTQPITLGIEIMAPPVVTELNEKDAVISIRFALPLREDQRVNDDTDEPMAMVPLYLADVPIMTFLSPIYFGGAINAPAKIATSPSGESVAYGCVEVKLWDLKDVNLTVTAIPQQIQLYAFSGQYLGGPTQIQFGEKSIVPKHPYKLTRD